MNKTVEMSEEQWLTAKRIVYWTLRAHLGNFLHRPDVKLDEVRDLAQALGMDTTNVPLLETGR